MLMTSHPRWLNLIDTA